MAIGTLSHLLAVQLTPAKEQEHTQVQKLAQQIQHVSGQTVKLAFAGQSYAGEEPVKTARDEGIDMQVIKLPEAKKGSFFCRDDGRFNAASTGSTGFDGSHATMNDSLKFCTVCISSSSLC
jgi:hypothetical protein